MKYRFKKAGVMLLALLACIFASNNSAHATTVVIPSDDDLIVGARAIVRARVVSVGCALDEPSDRVFTYVTLRVQEVLKGQIAERQIVIKQEGGQLPERGTILYGAPQFAPGEKVFVYLDTWPDGSLRVHQMFLGKFSITRDPATGKWLVIRQSPDASTTVLSAQSHADSASSVITDKSELSAYLEMVRARLAANRERAEAFEETYYKGVPVRARPAGYSRVMKEGIHPQFTFLGGSPARWFEPDSGQPLVFMVNPNGAPSLEIMDDVNAAMNAWSSIPGCSLRVVSGGPADLCGATTSANTIIFNGCDARWSPGQGCSGVLALGGCSWFGTITKVVNGTTFFKATAGFVSFNPYATCYFADHCSVREVATHEIGHTLGLGHTTDATATMFGVAHFDGRCAAVRPDDVAGITFIYPAVGGGPGPLTILTTSPLGVATVGSQFSRQLVAGGGVAPYTWSVSGGALPAGVSIASNGVISGTPTAAGASDFTVRVSDSQGATAEKSLSIVVVLASTGYESQFVSQTVPATLKPDQTFYVTIKWLNTGTKTWDGAAGFKIVAQNPANNSTWGGDTVPLINRVITPGEQLEMLFAAFAPRNAGTYNFQWQLYQDGVGFFGQKSENISIKVGDSSPPPPPDSPPSIGGQSNLEAVRGTPFTYTFTATGGTPPYKWQVSGTLAPGLQFDANTATISGTPTAAGNASITVQVTDSKSQAAQKVFSITVTPPAGPPVEITSGSLPAGAQGTGYGFQMAATGGKPPYTWAITAGALPPGLSINPASGIISGVLMAAGNYGFTVGVTDSESRTATRSVSVTVAPAPLLIQSSAAMETMKGVAFSHQLVATGGVAPYLWSMVSGALPPGLVLNPITGVISGTSTTGGTFIAGVTVRDERAVSVTGSLLIRVIDPDTIPVIKSVKYKASKKKLTVTGEKIHPTAALMIDGLRVEKAAFSDGEFEVKKFALSSGRHELVIINPNNTPSQPFILNVN